MERRGRGLWRGRRGRSLGMGRRSLWDSGCDGWCMARGVLGRGNHRGA